MRSCAHKAPTVHSLSLSKYRKTTKFNLQKKVSKINLRIISKPHAHLQSMMKTSVKFQNNRNKTVGGVAHTRYLLSIHFHYQNARKMTKFKLQKKCQKLI